MTYEEIQKLAFLARVEVSEEESSRLLEDMNNILDFLKQIEAVDVSHSTSFQRLKNITRDDENPHERGLFTEDLLREAPETLDGFIKVNKIL